MTLFAAILLLLLLAQGIASLAGGVRFSRFVLVSTLTPLSGATPSASIIAPIKGLDSEIEDNIGNLFFQDYPDYEIVFVIADPHDPARGIIERAITENPGRHARLLVARHEARRSQKINNLLHGVACADPASEILVFVDSDATVPPHWLRALVAPLADAGVGASTGYRWYLPAAGRFWSVLVSAWNGSIATTLGDHGRNFVWGGSAAIRRDTFDRIRVAERWDKALSDDYALTRAVQQAGLRIVFVPRCLLITREDFGLGSTIEFTSRQIIITRVYRPSVWWAGMISHSLFVAGFFGGIVWASYKVIALAARLSSFSLPDIPARAFTGLVGASHRSLWLIISLVLIYILGSLKGWLRLKAVTLLLPHVRAELRRTRAMFYLLWPLVSLVFLYDFIASATTRKIKWRGICYEMRSPTETVVLDPEKK